LLDRIDMRLTVPRLSRQELLGVEPGEGSASIRKRVERARAMQRDRYRSESTQSNAQLPGPKARRYSSLTPSAERTLAGAVDSLQLTGRGFDRALKVARTIADLAGDEGVSESHVVEALSYRSRDIERERSRAG
jgi:magnesium chelatase family protein